MNLIKKIFKFLIWFIYSVIVGIIILEIGLRFFPVSKPLIWKDKSEILRYEPHQNGVWSLGKSFNNVIFIESNNYGYRANYDYKKNSSPEVMIIGDSYVEAWQVDFKNSITGIVNNKINGQAYAMGISGSPLSQYEAFAIYAEKEFKPKKYVFVIVGNDFDESLCSVLFSRGRHCYNKDFKLNFEKYERNNLSYVARKSYLWHYITFNLNININTSIIKTLNHSKQFLFKFFKNEQVKIKIPKNEFVGNTEKYKDSYIENLSSKAVETFFYNIKNLLKNKKVIIVLDSDRNYKNFEKNIKNTNSFFSRMRTKVKNEAQKYKFEIIDMDTIFREHYKINREKFEFKSDGHWNSVAHKLVAREVIKALD